MAEFTLLELHLDGAEFTANAPLGSADDESEPASQSRSPASEPSSGAESTGRGRTLGLLALLALAVAAVAALALRGSADDDQ